MSYSFDALEGRYQPFTTEPCALEKQLQMNHYGIGNAAVRLSFLECPYNDETSNFSSESNGDGSIFCINVGNELRVCSQENQNAGSDRRLCGSIPIHLRFKAAPTTHSFRRVTDKAHNSQLLIGLGSGEIKLIDPLKEDTNKIFNEGKSIDETPVTCVSWVPHSPHQFLVSHSNGCMYLYNETLPPISTPSYTMFKQGIGFSVFTCKTKSTRNPLYRWVLGSRVGYPGTTNSKNLFKSSPTTINGYASPRSNQGNDPDSSNFTTDALNALFEETNVSINQFSFSPCGRFLAIVTDDGYLRVMEYHEMELYGFMRSYFGALLCVDWSPDSMYIATGGQDDLITIWSVVERAVICRGQGHKSWVSMVRFDPFLCPLSNSDTCHFDHGPSLSHSSSLIMNHEDLEKGVNGHVSTVMPKETTSLRTYRLGSVGHDTMLCLWELTDDIVRQGSMFVRSSISSLTLNLSALTCDNPYHPLSVNPYKDEKLNSSSSAATSSYNSPIAALGFHSPDEEGSVGSSALSSPHLNSSRDSSKPNNNNNSSSSNNNGNNSKGKSANAIANSTPSSAPNSTGGTSSGSDKMKTMFTLPRVFNWPNLGLSNRNANSVRLTRHAFNEKINSSTSISLITCNLSRLDETKWMLNLSENNLLGSPLCPRMGDVPVLEPLVCKAVLKDRVTDLIFRRDSIHVVDQQGVLLALQRSIEIKDCRSICSGSGSSHLSDWKDPNITDQDGPKPKNSFFNDTSL